MNFALGKIIAIAQAKCEFSGVASIQRLFGSSGLRLTW